MDLPPFKPFPKIPRLRRDCVITEKIDGTNAQVVVLDDGQVLAGSRTRWVTPEADNYGFAAWVKDHEEELRQLGIGQHFGEWWGQGIQRRYALEEKRFSLFNTARWSDPDTRPRCCGVVPVLYAGLFETSEVERVLDQLAIHGSFAAPGFMRPEGVVVYHVASGQLFKKLIENDEKPKGATP